MLKKVVFEYQDNVIYQFPNIDHPELVASGTSGTGTTGAGTGSDRPLGYSSRGERVEFPVDNKLYVLEINTEKEEPVGDNRYEKVITLLKNVNVHYLDETPQVGRAVRGYTMTQLVEIATYVGIKTSGKNKAALIKDIKDLMISYGLLK